MRRKEQDGLMKGPLVRFFNNLPIARKLLLTALIPLAAFMVLGIETYRSLETLTEHEEQLGPRVCRPAGGGGIYAPGRRL